MWSAPLGGRPLPGGLRADGLRVRPDVPPGGDGHPAPGDREFSPLGVGGVCVYRVGQTVERRLNRMITFEQVVEMVRKENEYAKGWGKGSRKTSKVEGV